MKQILIFLGILTSIFTFGQEMKTSDFKSGIQKFDISDLWTLNKFQDEYQGKISFIERQEPLGFIGENYQRFFIHFISVIQNPTNKVEYLVYGKTRVKNNICSFQGHVIIKVAKTYIDSDLQPLKQGFIKGEYEFFEDSDEKGTGFLKGNFTTDFYIDKDGQIKYEATMFGADEFRNNQFEGTWTSYKSKESKKCNWGDYRIPDSRNLDCGACEFGVSEKYVKNGWESYMTANGVKSGNLTQEEAIKIENEKWWVENEKK
jgi:hypothetical protein